LKISVNTNGGPGRPTGALNSQMKIRIEKVARMRVQGVKDHVIQRILDINPPAFKYLINLVEYQEVEEQILSGHLTDLDKATAGQADVLRQQAREAVPTALRTLVEAASQRRDLRTALAAAGELLDRDPDRLFTKSSKGALEQGPVLHRVPQGVIDITTSEADEVLNDLKSSTPNSSNEKERIM
jgi:hypothetical protein